MTIPAASPSSRFVARATLALALAGVVASQTGCKWLAKKATEKAIEKSTGAKNVDLGSSGGSVDIDDGNGTRLVSGNAVKLPSDWPSYLPAYPGAKIMTSVTNAQRQENTASMLTTDSPDKVMAFYKASLTSASFKSTGNVNLGELRSDTYSHSDGRQVVITVIGSDPKNTMVTVTGHQTQK